MVSPVEVTALLKVGGCILAGGTEGQVMVFNLNESETYHRQTRQTTATLRLQWPAHLPPLRKASFSSDYLPFQEDLLEVE